MIKVKHPDEECNQMQEAFLANCPADQRVCSQKKWTIGEETKGKEY
jgi:hypothetical protein